MFRTKDRPCTNKKSEVNKSMLTIVIMILRSHVHCFWTKEILYGLKENELFEMVNK